MNQHERTRLPGWASGLLIAVVGGLAGGSLSYFATIQTLERQTDEARATEDRGHRRDAYLDYLDAAVKYRDSISTVHAELRQGPEDDGSSAGAVDALTAVFPARADYQDAVNRLYVFGSDRAWREHQTVAATLPPSVGNAGEGFFDDVFDYTGSGFAAAYNGFLDVLCTELPADPRADCQ